MIAYELRSCANHFHGHTFITSGVVVQPRANHYPTPVLSALDLLAFI